MSITSRPRGRPAGATREEVLAAAARRFMAGERIDFSGLSDELGVSRPTLYRWFGTRDDLVGEVASSLLAPLLTEAARRAPRIGLSRALSEVADTLAVTVPLRQFLEQEQAAGLRILTSSAGRVQPTVVAAVQAIIEQEQSAGRYPSITDPEGIAYAIVRLTEAFLYNDAVAGLRADVTRLRPIVQKILDG